MEMKVEFLGIVDAAVFATAEEMEMAAANAYADGKTARENGMGIESNPFAPESYNSGQWLRGYRFG